MAAVLFLRGQRAERARRSKKEPAANGSIADQAAPYAGIPGQHARPGDLFADSSQKWPLGRGNLWRNYFAGIFLGM